MSGRRAAENTNTTPNDVRPVWLTREQRDLMADFADRDEMYAEIVTAWDAAPDPVKAVLANRNILYRTGMDELMGDLRALGYPDGLRRQDNPTP